MQTVTQGGKHALTRYLPLERFRGYTLARCMPVTGRTHQIRVHMKAVGHPLTVDRVYGRRAALFLSEFKKDYRPSRGRKERPLLDRLSLHAHRIRFRSLQDEEIQIECELPKDMRAAVKQLGRWRGR